ncbi:DUF4386 domain-containing protein [Thiomicrorhabdus sp.]|uniref:DUF4386 domain-containing protein n=1 Tax=Thiomicrorhabdus sp. TaxID=2039724 RepID=UPI0029C8BAEA|nr:DUF4386 domain-containing protein [Thiomicrorhabdus sp.]
MTNTHMSEFPSRYLARFAGFLYLIIILFGISSEVFIRSSLIDFSNPAVTAANLTESVSLFKLGFAADMIMVLCDVALAVLLFVLLKPVSRTLLLVAMVFRLLQASILGMNLLNYAAAALILQGVVYIETLGPAQLNALALLFLDLHRYGYDLGLVFFAVSNLIIGYLLVKARYFPAFLGYGLIAAALVYFSGSCVRFLFPESLSLIEPFYLIPLLAESAFCLWLLIKGVRPLDKTD